MMHRILDHAQTSVAQQIRNLGKDPKRREPMLQLRTKLYGRSGLEVETEVRTRGVNLCAHAYS